MARRKLVVFGILGTTLDAGKGNARWDRWRPTVALTHPCQRLDSAASATNPTKRA